MRPSLQLAALALAASSFALVACGGDDGGGGAGGGQAASGLSGTIRIDGSSTVAPLSEAAAELFNEQNPDVEIPVGTSGTGGGFEVFCRGDSDIADASRPIDQQEQEACAANNIAFEQITVANDALTVVVNPENQFVQCLSVEELNRIWRPQNPADNWSQVRQGFPDVPLERFGPGTDSGTFDYFTEVINGEEGAQTTDYNNVGEDDNATVRGVQGTEGGIGYFGFSFFAENQGQLKAVAIRNPRTGQCVEPSAQTAQNGTYVPLARELFVYPSERALQRPEVRAFLEFYIKRNQEITERAGLITLTEEQKKEALAKIERLTSGGGTGSSGSGASGSGSAQ